MNSDRDTDMTNLQALIGLWQDEEKRFQWIIKHPQTSPSVRDQASERLGFQFISKSEDLLMNWKP